MATSHVVFSCGHEARKFNSHHSQTVVTHASRQSYRIYARTDLTRFSLDFSRYFEHYSTPNFRSRASCFRPRKNFPLDSAKAPIWVSRAQNTSTFVAYLHQLRVKASLGVEVRPCLHPSLLFCEGQVVSQMTQTDPTKHKPRVQIVGSLPVKLARNPRCATTASRNLSSTTLPPSENFIPPENSGVLAYLCPHRDCSCFFQRAA